MKNRIAILFCVVLLPVFIITGCDNHDTISDEKDITSFRIGELEGVISGQTITVTVPYGTDLTSLTPVIEFTGKSISPASGTAQDFSNPVTYRVTADDGSVRDYTVTAQFADGKPSVTIAFEAFTSETVDLTADSTSDISRAAKDTLQISLAGIDGPIRWFINGDEQSETGGAITIAAADYPIGIHRVTALAYKDEVPYADEVIFKVVK
jgi:hypothetical protein